MKIWKISDLINEDCFLKYRNFRITLSHCAIIFFRFNKKLVVSKLFIHVNRSFYLIELIFLNYQFYLSPQKTVQISI